MSFVSKQGGFKYEEEKFDLVSEGLFKRLPGDATIFLLHKNDGRNYVEMESECEHTIIILDSGQLMKLHKIFIFMGNLSR